MSDPLDAETAPLITEQADCEISWSPATIPVVSRVVLVTVWVIAGALTFGLIALARELARPPAVVTPRDGPPSASGATLSRRDSAAWYRWTVTEQLSAHHVLVVHVETRYLDEAMSIARQIVDPLRTRYAEVLVYFHRPGRPAILAPRRIQWTRARGYVETAYD